jgi:hypothetical protein
MMKKEITAFLALALIACSGCGGGAKPANDASKQGGAIKPSEVHTCSAADHTHKYDLHDEDGDESLVPCAGAGKHDYSGIVHIETRPEGVHITIKATDDDVNEGVLGSDVKSRDAVIVYPKGPGSKAVEVPLKKSPTGYIGEKTILWEELDKIHDEGTKIDIAIFDHDDGQHHAEEMHVSVAVSVGKSCEKVRDENVETIDMGKKGSADLNKDQLGAPMKSSAFFSQCGLRDDQNAEICVAVKNGKPLGVSVKVNPGNNKVAACIDKATRKLNFPASPKLDIVTQKF